MDVNAANPTMWDRLARWWVEGFTEGADLEYAEQILPIAVAELGGMARVVDLGCGEGHLARAIAERGTQVTGIDTSAALLSVARQRGGAIGSSSVVPPALIQADLGSLPIRAGSADAALISLVLEHVEHIESVFSEVAAILRPGGRLCLFLNHPVTQTPGSGLIDDQMLDPPEQYWRIGPYLVESIDVEQVDRNVFIPFVHRPLSRYLNAAAAAGLLVEHMIEPEPPVGLGHEDARMPESEDALVRKIPRLMYLRLVRLDR
jgi:SAM-dependent methyltransferase